MALDARDIEINIGDYVRYVDTGTIGKIIDVKTEDDIEWVKIDKTNLLYRSKLVELLDEKDLKNNDDFSDDNNEIDIEAMKEKAFKMEELELADDACQGGG